MVNLRVVWQIKEGYKYLFGGGVKFFFFWFWVDLKDLFDEYSGVV